MKYYKIKKTYVCNICEGFNESEEEMLKHLEETHKIPEDKTKAKKGVNK